MLTNEDHRLETPQKLYLGHDPLCGIIVLVIIPAK
jgi:hypothetical protein